MKFTQSYLHNTRRTVQQYGFVRFSLHVNYLSWCVKPWCVSKFSFFLPSFLSSFFYRILKLDRNRLSAIVIYTRGDLESNLLSEESVESSSWIFSSRRDSKVGMFGVNVGNACDARRKLKNSERNISGLNILKGNILQGKYVLEVFFKYTLNDKK